MIPGEQLADTFASNHWLIQRLTEGLTHDDSLHQPPYRGNCINWIMGHLIANRSLALTYFGDLPLWEGEWLDRYQTGSEPITGPVGALPLAALLEALDLSQERLTSYLAETSPEDLGKNIATPRGERPLWQELSGLGWHETYHTGQLEILREVVAGSSGGTDGG